MAAESEPSAGTRLASVDAFRGLAVITFLFFNFLTSLVRPEEMAGILLHNQPGILLPGDLIAGFFAFLIGVGMSLSYERRKRESGMAQILARNFKRGIALLVIGLVLDSVDGLSLQWGVLQTLGIVLLAAMPFLPLGNRARMLAAAAILLSYGYLLQTEPALQELTQMRHGGPLGAISYAVVAIFGLAAGKWLSAGDAARIVAYCVAAGFAMLAAAGLASGAMPFDKLSVSPSYSLAAAGASMLIMALAYYAVEVRGLALGAAGRFGRNSLLAWIMQYPLLYWPLAMFGAYFSLGMFPGVVLTLTLVSIAYIAVNEAERRGLRISI